MTRTINRCCDITPGQPAKEINKVAPPGAMGQIATEQQDIATRSQTGTKGSQICTALPQGISILNATEEFQLPRSRMGYDGDGGQIAMAGSDPCHLPERIFSGSEDVNNIAW